MLQQPETETVTFRVPRRIAEALRHGARCSGSLNAAGEIEARSVILWKPRSDHQAAFEGPSNPP